MVDGQKFNGESGKLLNIKKVWRDGDVIQINRSMDLQKITYKNKGFGKVFLQRGPQVLALDDMLDTKNKLPAGWIGDQFYEVKGKINGEEKTFRMVPFADAGYEVGAHSISHPHLNECSPEVAEYEITESKKQLEEILNQPVDSFAYPYRHYPENYKAILKQAGYKYAVAMESSPHNILSDPYCIRRVTVEQGDTAGTFTKKLLAF